MFNSKFTIIIVFILILCLILTGWYLISNNSSESDSNITEHSEEVSMKPMIDENGNTYYVPAKVYVDEYQATS